MNRIKVLVADDHPAFREGLCQFLEKEKDIEVIAKAGDGEEAVTLARELQPDVAIIDVAMPKINGIEATRQIKVANSNIAVLVVSAYAYQSYLLAAVQAGAAGYLFKTVPVSQLINAVRSVYAGEGVFNMGAISKILTRVAAGGNGKADGAGVLHHRELEILKTAAKGLSNKQIANQLGISERTVQTHMFHIFRKLEVGSRIEAVFHALREGWLTPDDLS